MLVNHPQVNVIQRLERGVLHGIERNAVPGANAVAVVPVHQHIAPQHQRVAAPLDQQAALQRLMFIGGEGVDVGKQFVVNRDVHGVAGQIVTGRPF